MIPKFRVWDKKDRVMCDLISFFPREKEVDISNGYAIWRRPYKDIKIMQWTGLKDVWGDKIYEGDIIRGPYDTGIIGYEFITIEVKYDLLEGFQLRQFDLNRTEILGNIYENPELLKEYKLWLEKLERDQ